MGSMAWAQEDGCFMCGQLACGCETPSKEEPVECAICLAVIAAGELEELDCAHSFHCQCISRWRQQSLSCPICRTVTMIDPCRSLPGLLDEAWRTEEACLSALQEAALAYNTAVANSTGTFSEPGPHQLWLIFAGDGKAICRHKAAVSPNL